MLCFYVSVIRSVCEYAYPAWHSSLTVTQTKALESLQQRAMRIIFQDNDYMLSLIRARLDTLESRREHLTERFFKGNVLRESSCLHYLLPDKLETSITDKLRHPKTFKPLPIRLELLKFVILLYLSVYIIMIRPGAVAHYEFFLLHVPAV